MVRQTHHNKDNALKAEIKRFIRWNRSFGFGASNWGIVLIEWGLVIGDW